MAQTGYTPILIYSSSTAAQAPAVGNLTNSTLGSELAINITDGKLFYKDNANAVQVIAWKTTPTTAGGTGLTSYTAGDLLYYATGTTLTKLAIGSAYQALQVNAGGTAPSWQASATSTLTAQGDLLYASAANTLARLAKNTTATRYLSNTGSSNNPAWAQIDLTNGVTGTLPVANGGTGNTTGAATAVKSNATTGLMEIVGPGAGTTRVMTIPNANFTAARTDAAQTFSGLQTFGSGVSVTSGKLTVAYGAGGDYVAEFQNTTSVTPYCVWIKDAATPTAGYPLLIVSNSTGSSAYFRVDSSNGNATLGIGNLIQGTAAKGVNFTANTPAAGMTSQLLNWYEEGTWTPSLGGSGTAGTYELATASGWYTRVGRSITVIFNVKLAAAVTGGGTGFAVLSGLPFNTATTNAAAGAVTLGGVNYTAGTNYVTVMPRSIGSAQLIFEEVNINGAVNDMAISAFGINDTIQGALTYIV